MPTVRYIGPHDAVDIPDHAITGLSRGDTVDVTVALAAELTAREAGTSWELAPTTKGRPAADKES